MNIFIFFTKLQSIAFVFCLFAFISFEHSSYGNKKEPNKTPTSSTQEQKKTQDLAQEELQPYFTQHLSETLSRISTNFIENDSRDEYLFRLILEGIIYYNELYDFRTSVIDSREHEIERKLIVAVEADDLKTVKQIVEKHKSLDTDFLKNLEQPHGVLGDEITMIRNYNLILLAVDSGSFEVFKYFMDTFGEKELFQPTIKEQTLSNGTRIVTLFFDPLSAALISAYNSFYSIRYGTSKTSKTALLDANMRMASYALNHDKTDLHYKNFLNLDAMEMAILTGNKSVVEKLHKEKGIPIPKNVFGLNFKYSELPNELKMQEPFKGVDSFSFNPHMFLLLMHQINNIKTDVAGNLLDLLGKEFFKGIDSEADFKRVEMARRLLLEKPRQKESEFMIFYDSPLFMESVLNTIKAIGTSLHADKIVEHFGGTIAINFSSSNNSLAQNQNNPYQEQSQNNPDQDVEDSNEDYKSFLNQLNAPQGTDELAQNNLDGNLENETNELAQNNLDGNLENEQDDKYHIENIDLDADQETFQQQVNNSFLYEINNFLIDRELSPALMDQYMLQLWPARIYTVDLQKESFLKDISSGKIDLSVPENKIKINEMFSIDYIENPTPTDGEKKISISIYNYILMAIEMGDLDALKILVDNDVNQKLLFQPFVTRADDQFKNLNEIVLMLDPLSMALMHRREMQEVQNEITTYEISSYLQEKQILLTNLTSLSEEIDSEEKGQKDDKDAQKIVYERHLSVINKNIEKAQETVSEIESELQKNEKIIDFLADHKKTNLHYKNFFNLDAMEMAIITGNKSFVEKLHKEKEMPIPTTLWDATIVDLIQKEKARGGNTDKASYNLTPEELFKIYTVPLVKELQYNLLAEYLEAEIQKTFGRNKEKRNEYNKQVEGFVQTLDKAKTILLEGKNQVEKNSCSDVFH